VVQIGIAVSAGPVIAGPIGAAICLEYTVIGDAVNQAARLTDLAKAESGGVLASDPVVQCSRPG
jgi:adenylate cyclase